MKAIEMLGSMWRRSRLVYLILFAASSVISPWVNSAQAFQTHLFSKSFAPEGGFNFPLGVAINQSTEEVYVSDYNAGVVYAFEASGAPDPVHPTLTEATAGHGIYQFANPYGVAVDNSAEPTHGDIYVAGASSGEVFQFNPSGVRTSQAPITAAKVPANGTAQSGGLPNVQNNGGLLPTGVAVTSTGDIYVADQSNNVVDFFEPNGTFISQLAAEHISGPNLIAVDSSGNLYVAQNGSGLLEFSSTGTCLHSCTPIDPAANLGVAISPAGHVFADEGGQISEYEAGGSLIDSFGQPTSEPPFGGLSSSFDLALNNNTGDIYAANLGYGDVSVFGLLVTLPDLTTGPPTNPGQKSVTLTGHVGLGGGGEVTACRFEYGTDTSYSLGTIPCEPAAPYASATNVTAKLSGLTSETTYHYRLYAKNAEGASVGQDETFTPHSVAGLETKPATSLTTKSAQLNGSFVGNGEDTHYYFEWGTETSYGHKTALEDAGSPGGPGPTSLSFNLSGLSSLVTYHYRVVAENSAGISRGQDQEFTTLQAVAAITTEAPTEIKSTSATLNGSFVGNGEDTHYYFEWGTETSYGHVTAEVDAHSPGGPSPTKVSSELSGLNPFTIYHYRVVASNGGGTNYGGDQEFTTLPGPPDIANVSVSGVHSESALLRGQVNPENGDTSYHFEYGTEDCAVSSCAATPSVGIGSEPFPVTVSAQLTNLTPATVYHWRLVAESVGGTTKGPDRTFTTYSFIPLLRDPCPNAHARQQTGAALLLDCRAYELVSAPNTGGYDVESDLVPGQTPYAGYPEAENPSKVIYAVHGGGIPGAGHPTNKGPDPYIATRGEEGWSTEYVGVPANNPFATKPFSSVPAGASAGLETFAFGGAEGCSPCFEGGYTGIPVRLANGDLVQGMVPSKGISPSPTSKPDGYIATDLSANGEHLIFGSTSAFAPGGNNETGDVSIYDHNLKTGETHVVSNTPSTEDFPVPLPCLQGKGQCSAAHKDSNGISELALSKDGSHILLGQKVATDADGNVYWHLYMDINDSITSIDLTPGTTSGVLFDGMSEDGSKVFFTTTDKLLGADTDTSADIYESEVSPEGATLHLISTGSEGTGNSDSCEPVSNSAGPRWNTVGPAKNCGAVAIGGGGGVAGASGSIYFLSPEKLDGSSKGTANQPNLYLAAPGKAPTFIATLDPNDPVVLDAVSEAETRHTADFQITPSGEFAAFATTKPLGEYENAGYSEIYRYDASSEKLDCVSCNPSHAEASGAASMAGRGLSLTLDGRVFFNSTDALVLQDADNRQDVYEWEPQGIGNCQPESPSFSKLSSDCVSLISSGAGQFASSLLGASSDGSDAYFFTRESLTPQVESGDLVKVYDARELGGFPYSPPEVPCKAADECHGAGTPIPSPPTIDSANSTGGNARRKVRHHRCKAGYIRRHGKCVQKQRRSKQHHGGKR